MQAYTLRQCDESGGVIAEKQVDADSADAALRQLHDVTDTTDKIEVLNLEHDTVRQISASYWRQKFHRRRP